MSTEGNVQIYRGEHEKIRSLNDVGLDLSELCDRVEGLPGEGTKYVFPVRAQLTYFRLMRPQGIQSNDTMTLGTIYIGIALSSLQQAK